MEIRNFQFPEGIYYCRCFACDMILRGTPKINCSISYITQQKFFNLIKIFQEGNNLL